MSAPKTLKADDSEAIIKGILGAILQGVDDNEAEPLDTKQEEKKVALAGYLCVANLSTGYHFDTQSNKWSQAQFNTSYSRYLIKQRLSKDASSSTEDIQWVLSPIGDSWSLRCDGLPEGEFLLCQDSRQQFQFESKTKKFQYYYYGSYLNKPQKDAQSKESTYLEIGSCSSL
jgi:hypothetical protein